MEPYLTAFGVMALSFVCLAIGVGCLAGCVFVAFDRRYFLAGLGLCALGLPALLALKALASALLG